MTDYFYTEYEVPENRWTGKKFKEPIFETILTYELHDKVISLETNGSFYNIRYFLKSKNEIEGEKCHFVIQKVARKQSTAINHFNKMVKELPKVNFEEIRKSKT